VAVEPFGPADLDLTGECEHGLRVMRKTAMTLARVAFRIADGEHRRPAERVGREHRLRHGEPAVPPGACGPHDAGPDRAKNRIAPLLGSPDKGRGGRDARNVAFDARADGDGRLDEPALTERADSVREGDR
jgi:hypothetical protein